MSDTCSVEGELRREVDRETFQSMAQRYRPELRLHCYRMLGSLQDAEDTVQETLLRAWSGLEGFEGRGSLRGWLYRIATNECYRALARRGKRRRVLPDGDGPAVDFAPLGQPDDEIAWLDPCPDAWLEGVADLAPGPEAQYEAREAIRLAFVAALQALPARQRAVLLLRDVLGWSASDTAAALEASVPSVNSALQRSRAALRRRFPGGRPDTLLVSDPGQRGLIERYVRTWESADVDGFVALLSKDVVWTMPPWREWYSGPSAIRAFLSWAWRRDRERLQRLVPTGANAQPAFAYYRLEREGRQWRPFAIQVLALRGDTIAAVTNFVDPRLFSPFRLPLVVPVQAGEAESIADR